MSSKIIWDDNSANVYIHNLSRNLEESEVLNQRIESDCDIHSVTDLITSCMVNAAEFLKKTFTVRGTQKQSKQWFDRDCYVAKKTVRQHLRKYLRTQSAADRALYIRDRNVYKGLLNLKKRNHKCAISYKLTTSIHDSNLFWKQIRNLQNKCRVPDVISTTFPELFREGREGVEKSRRHGAIHIIANQSSTRT